MTLATPTFFDLAYPAFPPQGLSCQPAEALCGLYYGLGTIFPAETLYIGWITADFWSPSASVSVGDYVIAGQTQEFQITNRHVYVCTTAGTTGSAEPTWDQTLGATTSDGTAVWTEASSQFGSGDFSGAEPSDGGYARATLDNSSNINFQDPTTPNPEVSWPAATAGTSWPWVVGFFVADQSTGDETGSTNIYAWGLTSLPVNPSGVSSNAGPTPVMFPGLTHLFAGFYGSPTVADCVSGDSLTITRTCTGGTGRLLVVVMSGADTDCTVADDGSPAGTYTEIASAYISGSTPGRISVFYTNNPASLEGGSVDFTVSWSAGTSSTFLGATLIEFSVANFSVQGLSSPGGWFSDSGLFGIIPVQAPGSVVIAASNMVGVGGGATPQGAYPIGPWRGIEGPLVSGARANGLAYAVTDVTLPGGQFAIPGDPDAVASQVLTVGVALQPIQVLS